MYGHHGNDELTEDSSVQESDFPTKLCLRWEAIARRAEPYTGVVLLRTGIVLAPPRWRAGKNALPFKLCLGGRIGSGEQYTVVDSLPDHINAMRYLLSDSSLSGPVNLVAPNPQTNSQFTQALAEELGRIAIFPVPTVMSAIARRIGLPAASTVKTCDHRNCWNSGFSLSTHT